MLRLVDNTTPGLNSVSNVSVAFFSKVYERVYIRVNLFHDASLLSEEPKWFADALNIISHGTAESPERSTKGTLDLA